MTFTAQDLARAPALRDSFPVGSYVTGDVSQVSSIVLADCPGLAVQLDRDSTYLFEGYISYTANAGGDFRCGIGAPPDVTGRWTIYGQDDPSTGSVGNIKVYRFSGFGDGNTVSAAGSASFSGAMSAALHGAITTQRFAGVLQLRFSQQVVDAGATTIKAGSWIRATKVT